MGPFSDSVSVASLTSLAENHFTDCLLDTLKCKSEVSQSFVGYYGDCKRFTGTGLQLPLGPMS